MTDFLPLTDRWQAAEWSDSEYSAVIPSFVGKEADIVLSLEVLTNGQTEWQIHRRDGKQIGEGISPSKEKAASDCLFALREHFRGKRKSPTYILQYLPWQTDRQLKAALDTVQSTANNWRHDKTAMCRRSITMACRHMGIWGYARGGGELCKLIPPYWETPEYCMSPINQAGAGTGKNGRKPGAAWWGKNAKKNVDTPTEP